jgi:hypothetical protein
VTLNGFTFQSYYNNVGPGAAGYLSVINCNFTAPTSGVISALGADSSGFLDISGTCQYTGATPSPTIFGASGGAVIRFGYHDAIYNTPLIFNIAGTPTVTEATIVCNSGGTIYMYNQAVSFTGGVPACAQYNVSTTGGITFSTGVTTIFPGTQPGVVTPPGWTQ